jgi:hypothetical protein
MAEEKKVVPIHTMKACMGSRGIVTLTPNLSIRCMSVVNFTPQPFTSEKEQWHPLNKRMGEPQSQS